MNEDLERELRDLGPLMAEQAQFEQEGPDPAFAAQLRARLVAQAADRANVPKRRPLRLPRLTWQWGGLGGAALVAAVVALVLLRSGGSTPSPISPGGARVARFVPPTPSKADVTKSFPLPVGLGGGGGPASPTHSSLGQQMGSPYSGKLILSGQSLPTTPATLHAYRLEPARYSTTRVKKLAAAYGVHGPVKRIRDFETIEPQTPNVLPPTVTWLVVQQGTVADLRSVAVSARTGVVIYHNLGAVRPSAAGQALPSHAAALAAARAWLNRAGWPGDAMPTGRPRFLTDLQSVTVSFGWPGVSSVDRNSASVRIQRGGQVDEALLLPPLRAVTSVKPRSIQDAWRQVQTGKAPVGVENPPLVGPAAPAGQGTLRHVSVEQVVTFTKGGRIYLVPAYLFTGTVTLHGVRGARAWLALVPAV